jgi:hypothetical protein
MNRELPDCLDLGLLSARKTRRGSPVDHGSGNYGKIAKWVDCAKNAACELDFCRFFRAGVPTSPLSPSPCRPAGSARKLRIAAEGDSNWTISEIGPNSENEPEVRGARLSPSPSVPVAWATAGGRRVAPGCLGNSGRDEGGCRSRQSPLRLRGEGVEVHCPSPSPIVGEGRCAAAG